ncbi:tRNA lysidine(34) synthetase TilS [Leptothrix ochracea]|uniref:tRNA lysidine(34) synthetase TilS n=1 Tax=Leptothrix ochracea TaxID=735331 RepID=UPI0034E2764C
MIEAGVVAVAFSGGRDSTALLHALCRAAEGFPLQIHAIHVNHGLSAHALTWERHCRAVCRRWQREGLSLQFHAARVTVDRHSASGIEAAARDERYAALRRIAAAVGAKAVVLAQHRDDQAETVLLQALRGASVAGLAAMPRAIERGGLLWLRPWLACPRSWIESYLRRHRLSYIDDDSNTDPKFARNRLRRQVWPALKAAFPQVETVLADVATHAQDAAACLDALAALDEQQVVVDGARGLAVAALLALGPQRGRNLLRHWLGRIHGPAKGVRGTLIARLWDELPSAKSGAKWLLSIDPPLDLRLYRGVLCWHHGAAVSTQGVMALTTLTLQGPGTFELAGWQGALDVTVVASGGVPANKLLGQVLELRGREAGVTFQRHPASLPRALKKQYQFLGVPEPARVGPLMYLDGQLIFVPALGLDARFVGGSPSTASTAQPDEVRLDLRWIAMPQAGVGEQG